MNGPQITYGSGRKSGLVQNIAHSKPLSINQSEGIHENMNTSIQVSETLRDRGDAQSQFLLTNNMVT